MKIVFIGSRSYYGESDSYEYLMEASSLTDIGHDVTFVRTELPNLIDRVERAVKDVQPDCIIYHAANGEMDMTRFSTLSMPKLLILADDDWRRDYGLALAPFVDYVLPAGNGNQAEAYGSKYVPFQWGFRKNWYAVKAPDTDRSINVSFIGLNYGYRKALIDLIQGVGIPVECWGHGWDRKIPSADIPQVLWKSWISLNTSMSSDGTNTLQIKARNFEVPASRALLITEYAPTLEHYFKPDEEAVFWRTPDELVEKVQYYLTHKDVLAKVATAGYQRALNEHTYDCRWETIFKAVGL